LDRQDERRKFYKAMDKIRKGCHPRQEACRDKDGKVLFDKEEIMNRWIEYFKDALNKEYPSCNGQGKSDLALNTEENVKGENREMPTYGEIEESIKKLKNGRASAEDNIPEMIKHGGKQLVKKLHELMSYGGKKRCLKTGKLVLSAPYSKKVINLTATTIEALHYWI